MTVGISFVSPKSEVVSLSTAGHILRVPGSRPEAQSLSENGHSSDCESVLDSVVRCLTTRLLSTDPAQTELSSQPGWICLPFKLSISIHILVEFKVVLKYIQQYPQHLVHFIFIIKQSTKKKIQLYLNLLISVSYDDQKAESFCA